MQRSARRGTSGTLLARGLYYKGLLAILVGAVRCVILQRHVVSNMRLLHLPSTTTLLLRFECGVLFCYGGNSVLFRAALIGEYLRRC